MLAVKLHFKKRPFIGKGSYWIPVTTWRVAGDQIRTWLPNLVAEEGGTGKRAYITLAKIPEDHLVWMGTDWIGFDTETPLPLRDVPAETSDHSSSVESGTTDVRRGLFHGRAPRANRQRGRRSSSSMVAIVRPFSGKVTA